MKPVVLSATASADLESIADYIAKDNPRRAVTIVLELEARCQRVGEFPEAARKIEGLRPGVRTVPYTGYVIVYRIRRSDIIVERIWHGSRDILSLLQSIKETKP